MANYCVYKHTAPNGKVYIGITGVDPLLRWKNGKGYGCNKHFTNAIEHYGWGNIKHEILLSGLTEDEAKREEIELIKLYDSMNTEKGYNLHEGGNIPPSQLGVKQSEETKLKRALKLKGHIVSNAARKKISEAVKRAARTDERIKISLVNLQKAYGKNIKEKNGMYGKHGSDHPSSKTVIQLSKNNEIINVFDNAREAVKSIGLPNGAYKNISACCHNRRLTAYGYCWRFSI